MVNIRSKEAKSQEPKVSCVYRKLIAKSKNAKLFNVYKLVNDANDSIKFVIMLDFKTYLLKANRKKTGYEIEKELNSHAVVPVEILTAFSDGENKLEMMRVKFLDNSSTLCETLINVSALGDPSSHKDEIKRLAEKGLTWSFSEWGRTGKILIEISRNLRKENKINLVEGTQNIGWTGSFNDHILPQNPLYCGNLAVLGATAGNAEKWKNTFAWGVNNSLSATLMSAAATGSFLRGILQMDVSNIVHIWGKGGVGKTLSQKVAASIIGEPAKGKAIAEWTSTAVGIEHLLQSANHSFLCLDEINGMYANAYNDQSANERLMRMANGGGRAKSGKDGTIADARLWNSTILSTGNIPVKILEGHEQETALKARVIQLNLNEHMPWDIRNTKQVAVFERDLAENYGHGYKLIIEYIIKNKETIEKQYYKIVDDGPDDEVMGRKYKSWALILLGMDILEAVLKVELKHKANIYGILESEVQLEKEVVQDTVESTLQNVIGFVFENRNRFLHQGYFWNENQGKVQDEISQKGNAFEYNEVARKAKILGKITQAKVMENESDFNALTVHITASAGKEATERAGLNLDALAEVAKGQGWLKEGKQRTQNVIKIMGATARCYSFDISKAMTLVAESESMKTFDNFIEQGLSLSDMAAEGVEVPF